MPPEPKASPDTVDSVNLDENCKDVESPNRPEPSEGDTKTRRVESTDKSVDWVSERKGVRCLIDKFFTRTRNLGN